jgi:TonB family protein
VNSLGYQQNNAILRNNNNVSNNIILQEADAALEEVVVVGYGAKGKREASLQKRDSARLKAMEDVEPLGGWDEYDTYISSNIRKPSGMDDVDGEVILSFEVNEKNEISNIKIIKSLSKDLDQEAVRLVKEGPQWKPKKGRKAKGKLAIKF